MRKPIGGQFSQREMVPESLNRTNRNRVWSIIVRDAIMEKWRGPHHNLKLKYVDELHCVYIGIGVAHMAIASFRFNYIYMCEQMMEDNHVWVSAMISPGPSSQTMVGRGHHVVR